MNFGTCLHALYRGEMSFETFTVRTQTHWTALAMHLLRRWSAGPRMGVDDVRQELLLACWWFLPKWDHARGRDLESFIVWNAIDKAKKKLNKERGAKLHGNADGNPSRLPVSLDRPFRNDKNVTRRERDGEHNARKWLPGGMKIEATQEAKAEARMLFRRALASARGVREVLAVQALQEASGCEETASRILYEDTDARLMCRLGSERSAQRLIRRASQLMRAA